MKPENVCRTNDYYVHTGDHSDPFTNSVAFDGWDLEYVQLSPGQYHCQTKELWISGLQIYTEIGNVTSHQFGIAWADSFVFALPWSMAHEGRVNGRSWMARELVMFRGENDYDALVPPTKLLIVAISRKIVAEYMETVEHVAVHDWLKRGMFLVNDTASIASMIEVFIGMLDVCHEDPEVLSHPEVRSALMQKAMETLAPLILQNFKVPAIVHREFNHVQIVRRAREFLLDNISEPTQIIDVCRELRISRRVLQYSFQDLLNINPVSYLRLLRLNGARHDLVNASDCTVQVKDVVASWGFWHLSRFSSEYKKIFNELPSETLSRVKKGVQSNFSSGY
ncbi:helix-turn-helix domain-containing protein [Pseudomonas citri]|uniref:helix-turn-helix domain-containing protein n=1 Tax=Pseudomonas citri TaxID=2978349 RepID=UPI0021B6080F|nr:helix-turn-helix domain-containing protein [Pseudomonas citri]